MFTLPTINKNEAKEKVLLFLLLIAFYLTSKVNYLLFHTIVEFIAIIMGVAIMAVTIGTKKMHNNGYVSFLALGCGFISIIDFFHTISYKGINIIAVNTNIPTQLWIASRYYECIILIGAFIFINRDFNYKKVITINSIAVVYILISIILFGFFPDCYIEGYGLTKFKIISEYIVILGFIFIAWKFIKIQDQLINENKKLILISINLKIISGLFFTMYFDVFSGANFYGHIFEILSFYYFYKFLFKNIIVNPYSIIFKKLNEKIMEQEKLNKKLLKAKDKIEYNKEIYTKYMNFAPDGILIIRNKYIEFANSRFLKMIGIHSEKDIINKSIFSIIEDSYHDKVKERLDDNKKYLSEAPCIYEMSYGNKKIWVEAASLVLLDEKGEYYLTTIRDISDRKKTEEIEQLLKVKEKEDEMKSEFFSNISHELRTPINVIYSALQLQNDCIDNLSKELIIKYNKIINKNCLRLIKLINNIIDITKIDSGYFKVNMSVQNIISLVEEVTLSSVNYAESKKINLIFDTEVEEAYVNCDSDLIKRLMLNLLSNSVKYSNENGNIEVSIVEMQNSLIMIKVKDSGVGIPEEMHSKVFKRFEKTDKSLSRNNEGVGIGLALVKRLVEIQNGSITFNSNINEGTEFFISFPIIDAALEVSATAERTVSYEENIVKSVDMEFSDIYY